MSVALQRAARAVILALIIWTGAAASAAPAEAPPLTTSRPDGGFLAPGFELADISAWTLRDGELEIGPTTVRYGFLDLFQLGSRFGLNLFGALNAEAKWTIHASDRIAVGVDGGFLRFDPELVGVDDDFAIWAFPVALRASGRPNDSLRLHVAVEFLSYKTGGQASDAVLRVQRYLGPVGRLAGRLGLEWRLGENVAVLAELETPFILHRASFRYVGEDDAFDFLRGKLALQLVYQSLNVRLGGGYGPSFLGKSGLFPVIELALRIY